MKTISVITPCYNEEQNVREVYNRVRAAICSLGDQYRYEHIFIDNASTDSTFEVLKGMAAADKNVKLIRNTRNFGQIRSPMHALYQTCGDAVIVVVADLQDPPEMIPAMIRHWESGTPVVIGVKESADEHGLMFWLRKRYYRLVQRLSGIETYENFTGFGLYDRKVLNEVLRCEEPYPYFRGIIAELGFPRVELPYHQPTRKRGITKNNWYSLYDYAMLGITSLSKVPLRLAVLAGVVGACASVLLSIAYLVYKLVYWTRFSIGIAPLIIGGFFIASLQLLFLGILGEYIGAIHTKLQKRPFAVELDRVNFEFGPGEPLRESTVSEYPSCAQ